ncbi:unnamed protein product [Didymodactylos carnosus]|uniref:RNA-dependent RNA polymerase n=1 Tax=Didymodactylos carnosus TaxID=1234261 RepID=A0A8S2KG94_9BILA|nr:unnamed protein product [Didymodactylos carnosus]CAF3843637.1 unnamed protein product [Didymodactylos carnosus]CAF4549420.1 unnamed protein product [Didymodactylos carnosus]
MWLQDSVPQPENQIEPLAYDATEKKLLNRQIIIDDVAEFLIDSMANDFLGELSKIISAVVDYPKTGVNPVIDESHRALKPPRFPDYMKKELRSYRSRKVLGI